MFRELKYLSCSRNPGCLMHATSVWSEGQPTACGLHSSSVLSLPRISSPCLVPYFCFWVPREHIERQSTQNPVFSQYNTLIAPRTHLRISQHLEGMDAVIIRIVYALCCSYKRLSTNTPSTPLEGLYSFQVSTGWP